MEFRDHIIGFDLRIPRARDDPWFSDYLLSARLETIVSIDPFVFPVSPEEGARRANEETKSQLNCLGLLKDLSGAKANEWTIALTAREDIARRLVKKSGVPLLTSPLSRASDLAQNGWDWLGYDVADIGKLISGLMNCGPHMPEVVTRFSSSVNQYGLFRDAASADDFCAIRDLQIPDHSPFCPVSIWRRVSSG